MTGQCLWRAYILRGKQPLNWPFTPMEIYLRHVPNPIQCVGEEPPDVKRLLVSNVHCFYG